MNLDGLDPPTGCVAIPIRIPREHRALLHFHLEASDGFGYLEQGNAPDRGIVQVPPGLEQEVRDWLVALQDELQIEFLARA